MSTRIAQRADLSYTCLRKKREYDDTSLVASIRTEISRSIREKESVLQDHSYGGKNARGQGIRAKPDPFHMRQFDKRF